MSFLREFDDKKLFSGKHFVQSSYFKNPEKNSSDSKMFRKISSVERKKNQSFFPKTQKFPASFTLNRMLKSKLDPSKVNNNLKPNKFYFNFLIIFKKSLLEYGNELVQEYNNNQKQQIPKHTIKKAINFLKSFMEFDFFLL